MIGGLKPYPTYKESGVEWLGKVPAHWEVVKLKLISKRIQNGSTPPTDMLEYYSDEGLPWYGPPSLGSKILIGPPMRFVTEQGIADRKVRVIQPPALAVSVIGNVGKSALMLKPGATNQQITCFELNDQLCNPRLVVNQFRMAEECLVASASSATIAILDSCTLRNTPLTLPPFPEQTAIVRFLDWADHRIRRVIRTRQRRIKLLEEYKQALIHQAVTGQIDVCTGKPYPAYKDSGVVWLGQVPEHWEVGRLRTLVDMRVSNVDKHSKEGQKQVRLCNYVDVYKHDKIRADMDFMQATASDEEIERFHLQPGDVLITKDSEMWYDIAVPALVETSAPDLISGYHLALLRPRHSIQGAFLFRAIQSPALAYQFHIEANGVTRFGLSHGAIKSALISLPPLPEQIAIVEYLDAQTAKIDAAIVASRREIDLLREYHTRLISDVVTGKVDVREVATQLPEEPAEEEEPLRAEDAEAVADEETDNNEETADAEEAC